VNPVTLLSRFLFPPRCPFCGELLPLRESPPCVKCREVLPRATEDSHTALPGIERLIAPLYYEGAAREALTGLKFRRRFSGADPLAALMAEAVRRGAHCAPDENADGQWPPPLVTWAPLSRQKMRERGFDQALLLAGKMCMALGWPKPVRLLKKTKQRAVQSSLAGDGERRANASGSYAVVRGGLAKGRQILLVDDICTSGATLSECARLLREAGAASVSAVVGARRRN
jgi:ComF family protein